MDLIASDEVRAIRDRIDHPVVDGDGHLIEYIPLVRDFMVEMFGADMGKALDGMVHGSETARKVAADQRRDLGMSRTAFWGLPTRNTLDRATAMLPELMYKRLDELGIDFALLYPTYGLTVTATPDDEVRCAMARACNRYYAEVYDGFRDRLEPVAAIPMFTPDEAIAELDYAVGELGLKAVMMTGVIPRSITGGEDLRAARWIDCIGHDSLHDYDRVWQRCLDLGVSPTFHGSGMGWGSRTSTNNYVFNHIGNFAAAGEAAARSIVLGGAAARFPDLRWAFLEGGVAWACNLYSDILGHFEKRNREAITHYDPAELDRPMMEQLMADYAPDAVRARLDDLDEGLLMLCDPNEDQAVVDEFAQSGITSAEDLEETFTKRFYFGCEADDPMNALAFRSDLNPGGARLPAIFASDVGHWDVPDMREVLPEAWELVDDGHLTEEDFAEFTFGNVVDLLTATNPTFFDGTVVESQVNGRRA